MLMSPPHFRTLCQQEKDNPVQTLGHGGLYVATKRKSMLYFRTLPPAIKRRCSKPVQSMICICVKWDARQACVHHDLHHNSSQHLYLWRCEFTSTSQSRHMCADSCLVVWSFLHPAYFRVASLAQAKECARSRQSNIPPCATLGVWFRESLFVASRRHRLQTGLIAHCRFDAGGAPAPLLHASLCCSSRACIYAYDKYMYKRSMSHTN